MDEIFKEKEILVIGKTYPVPSRKYTETTCVGGITRQGEWIRIFPIQFRFLDDEKKFRRYDWIKAHVCRHRDPFARKESHKVLTESIKICDHMGCATKNEWIKRNQVILPLLDPDLETLYRERDKNGKTMGIIQVREENLLDFYKEAKDKDEEVDAKTFNAVQQTIYGGLVRPLEIFPFRMKFSFKCNNLDCKGHKISCFDWEMHQLFRKEKQRLGNDDTAFESLKKATINLFRTKDMYFTMGTESLHNNFIIGGVYYPPKGSRPEEGHTLFDFA